MRITSLSLLNYRLFKHQSFVFNEHFTVLIGGNATGKTQILQAISMLLSQFQATMLRMNEAMKDIALEDVHHESQTFDNQTGNHQLRMEYSFPSLLLADFNDGERVFCRRTDAKEGNERNAWLEQQATLALSAIEERKNITLPVLAYYGTCRLWSRKNRAKAGIPSRTDGYRWSLDAFIDFDELKDWFMNQELIFLQKGTNRVVLSVMRQALSNMIPGCETVFYDFEMHTLVLVMRQGTLLPNADRNLLFEDLSDGYRMVLTMVFDIVKQMILLNPHLGEHTLMETDGIILIDELDMSLHPTWQRVIVDCLKTTFPKVQFIVTTHSPFIIQSLMAGEVIDLALCQGEVLEEHLRELEPQLQNNQKREDDIPVRHQQDGIAWPETQGEYERQSLEDVTENVMGVVLPQRSARLQRMYDVAKQYYAILESSNNANDEEKEKIKEKLDILSSPFSSDVAYCAYLDFKRKMKGL